MGFGEIASPVTLPDSKEEVGMPHKEYGFQ